MKTTRILLLASSVIACAGMLAGCGNNGLSSNSGSLSLVAPKAINVTQVSTSATYGPASGSPLPNQEIEFFWYAIGATSKNSYGTVKVIGSTDTSGTATSKYTIPANAGEALDVCVYARTGDLDNKEGTLCVRITQ